MKTIFPPPPRSTMCRADELAHVKAACQCSFDDSRERLRVEVEEIGASLKRWVAHEDVDAPQVADRPADDALARGAIKHVALDQHGMPAQRLDLGDNRLGLSCRLAVVDRDVGPRSGQLKRAPSADPAPHPLPVPSCPEASRESPDQPVSAIETDRIATGESPGNVSKTATDQVGGQFIHTSVLTTCSAIKA